MFLKEKEVIICVLVIVILHYVKCEEKERETQCENNILKWGYIGERLYCDNYHHQQNQLDVAKNKKTSWHFSNIYHGVRKLFAMNKDILSNLTSDLLLFGHSAKHRPFTLSHSTVKHFIQTVTDQQFSFNLNNESFTICGMLNIDDVIILEEVSKSDYANVYKAHTILTKMIQNMKLINFRNNNNYFVYDVDYLNLIFKKIAIMITLLLIVVIMIQNNLLISWSQLLIKLLVMSFLISVPWNWWYMYQKALARRQAEALKDTPAECHPKNQTIWTTLYKIFSLRENKCGEYYEKLLVDPVYEISPTQAFSVTFTKFIFEPFEYLGKAIGKMIHALLNELPAHIWPAALVFLYIVAVSLLILMFKHHIKILNILGIMPIKDSHLPQCKCTEEIKHEISMFKLQLQSLEHHLSIAPPLAPPQKKTKYK